MEIRQADNDGGHYDGGASRWGALWSRWTMTCTSTSSDQWSNLKNNWIFVLESCI